MTKERSPASTDITDRPRRRGWRILKITLSVFMACLLTGGGALAWLVYAVPLDLATDRTKTEPAVIVEASDATLIGLRGELRGTLAVREDLPDHLVNAVVAIEDRRFFDHVGIDVRGVARAAWRNFRANGVVEGGSTITQQLAKIEFLTSERTMKRKADEALIALRLEARLSKDEILARYLNNVYFGGGLRNGSKNGWGASSLYRGTNARPRRGSGNNPQMNKITNVGLELSSLSCSERDPRGLVPPAGQGVSGPHECCTQIVLRSAQR